jgi:hypothetical protein
MDGREKRCSSPDHGRCCNLVELSSEGRMSRATAEAEQDRGGVYAATVFQSGCHWQARRPLSGLADAAGFAMPVRDRGLRRGEQSQNREYLLWSKQASLDAHK